MASPEPEFWVWLDEFTASHPEVVTDTGIDFTRTAEYKRWFAAQVAEWGGSSEWVEG